MEANTPVSLSVKNAPDEMVAKLRQRAQRHHRSLQGELMDILEKALDESRFLTIEEALREIRHLEAELITLDKKLLEAAHF